MKVIHRNLGRMLLVGSLFYGQACQTTKPRKKIEGVAVCVYSAARAVFDCADATMHWQVQPKFADGFISYSSKDHDKIASQCLNP